MNIGRTNAYSVSNAAFNKQAANVENKEANKVTVQSEGNQGKHANALDVLNAMDIMGKQNVKGLNMINPAKYLTPERIADIQASMAKFEAGVSAQQKVVAEELAGTPQYEKLSEADKLAFAAHAYVASEE